MHEYMIFFKLINCTHGSKEYQLSRMCHLVMHSSNIGAWSCLTCAHAIFIYDFRGGNEACDLATWLTDYLGLVYLKISHVSLYNLR